MNSAIYKICTRAEWQTAKKTGTYKGSSDDRRDGFIHFSTAAQLAGTLAKHFAGQDELLLIAFASADLSDGLKWERSRGGDLFPHFYGELDVDAARQVHPLEHGPQGHILPLLEGE